MNKDKHIEIRKLIREELLRLNETRMVTYTGEILYNIAKNVPGIIKTIASNSMASGSEGIYRYKDGNAYEIQVRPIAYANDKQHWRKYTLKNQKPKEGPKVTTEDMKQALWLAFKETADAIEFVGDNASLTFKINYNETFDVRNLESNIQKLQEYGVGTFTVEEAGPKHVILKHKNGTGDPSVFNELIKQQTQ